MLKPRDLSCRNFEKKIKNWRFKKFHARCVVTKKISIAKAWKLWQNSKVWLFLFSNIAKVCILFSQKLQKNTALVCLYLNYAPKIQFRKSSNKNSAENCKWETFVNSCYRKKQNLHKSGFVWLITGLFRFWAISGLKDENCCAAPIKSKRDWENNMKSVITIEVLTGQPIGLYLFSNSRIDWPQLESAVYVI